MRFGYSRVMSNAFEKDVAALKEKLLLMASHAEAAVNRSVKALIRRDDNLARRTKEEDSVIDQLEIEIDEAAHRFLIRLTHPLLVSCQN